MEEEEEEEGNGEAAEEVGKRGGGGEGGLEIFARFFPPLLLCSWRSKAWGVELWGPPPFPTIHGRRRTTLRRLSFLKSGSRKGGKQSVAVSGLLKG